MTRATWHTFTTAAPVFAFDDYDPFFDEAHPAQRGATLVNSPSESRTLSPFESPAPAFSNEGAAL